MSSGLRLPDIGPTTEHCVCPQCETVLHTTYSLSTGLRSTVCPLGPTRLLA